MAREAEHERQRRHTDGRGYGDGLPVFGGPQRGRPPGTPRGGQTRRWARGLAALALLGLAGPVLAQEPEGAESAPPDFVFPESYGGELVVNPHGPPPPSESGTFHIYAPPTAPAGDDTSDGPHGLEEDAPVVDGGEQ